MVAIFIANITPGTTVAWTDRHGTNYEGVAVRIGVTHPVESYILPPSTPYVVVEMGDGSHRGPVFRRDVTASQIKWAG